MNNDTNEASEKLELTDEQELILKGIRPEGMEYEQFKFYRKLINKHIKLYLKGKLKE
jgi:hypothetical protein